MQKLILLLLIGLILTLAYFGGILQADEDEGKEEVKEEEGYRLTPEDKRSQLISILLILAVMVLTI